MQEITSDEEFTRRIHCHEDVITRRIHFQDVQIRTYNLVLGESPSVSSGPALSLDWKYVQQEPRLVDDYEASRGPLRRKERHFRLSAEERQRKLIEDFGLSLVQLNLAAKRRISRCPTSIVHGPKSSKEPRQYKESQRVDKVQQGIIDPCQHGPVTAAAWRVAPFLLCWLLEVQHVVISYTHALLWLCKLK